MTILFSFKENVENRSLFQTVIIQFRKIPHTILKAYNNSKENKLSFAFFKIKKYLFLIIKL